MTASETLNILIVDDEEIVQCILKEFVMCFGHRATIVKDGASALKKLEGKAYDAVITDIRMPGMDGITFLKAVKRRRPDLPVIVITGYGHSKIEEEVRQSGAFAYLEKPFKLDDIQRLVEDVADSRREKEET